MTPGRPRPTYDGRPVGNRPSERVASAYAAPAQNRVGEIVQSWCKWIFSKRTLVPQSGWLLPLPVQSPIHENGLFIFCGRFLNMKEH